MDGTSGKRTRRSVVIVGLLVSAIAATSFGADALAAHRSRRDGYTASRRRESRRARKPKAPVVTPAPTPGVRFGAYSPPSPEQGMTAIDGLQAAVGRPIQIVSFYQAWGDGDHGALHPEWLSAATAGGRDVLLTWEPWVSGGNANQPAYSLSTIVSGRHDTYIRSWVDGLKRYSGTVYLRPMHEMNGTWYPWGGTVNGNSPELYVGAWRHMHDIFASAGVTNVRWVWSPLVDDVPSWNTFERYYPGTGYVDVLALDGYNWGTSEPGYGGWRSFEQLFRSAYDRIGRLGPQTIWVAETASAAEGGDKATWVRDMFASLGSFPRLQGLVWFNMNFPGQRDWRATSPEGVASAFAIA